MTRTRTPLFLARRAAAAAAAALLGVAVALPVSADAPTDGPDRQYENFTATDKEIKDHFTGLVWERPASPYPAKMTLAVAMTYCANGSRRLPSLKELLTLVDEEPHLEYDGVQNTQRMIDRRAFPATPPEEFWTSSLRGARNATVDFGTGKVFDATPTDPRRVRCVRLP